MISPRIFSDRPQLGADQAWVRQFSQSQPAGFSSVPLLCRSPAAGHVYVRRRLAPPGLDGLPEFSVLSAARLLFLFSPGASFDPPPDSPEARLSLSRSLSFSRPLPERSVFTEELLPDGSNREGTRGGRKRSVNIRFQKCFTTSKGYSTPNPFLSQEDSSPLSL